MKTFARSSSASRRADPESPVIASARPPQTASTIEVASMNSQQVRVQRDQDLFRQVVDDVAVRRAERVDERLAVGRRLHREVREVQAGRPALGPLVEGLDRRRIEVEREDVVEQLLRFVRGELEVGRAELDEVADRAQAGDRERRVRPARDRHLDDRRRELDEPHDALVALVVLDDVVVVEDEDALLAQRVDLGRDRRRRVGLPGETLEALAPAAAVDDATERRREVRPEDRRVVVEDIDRHPGEWPRVDVGPVRQQRRLAEPGRGDDQVE